MRRVTKYVETINWTGAAWESWPEDDQPRIFNSADDPDATAPTLVRTVGPKSTWVRHPDATLPAE